MILKKRDEYLIRNYVAWGKTSSGYMVYLYYIGQDNSDENRTKLENYQIINPSHLKNFHYYYTNNYRQFLSKTSNIKETYDKNKNPEYDPRFFIYKWQRSSSFTDEIKKLINDYSKLFEVEEPNIVKKLRREEATREAEKSGILLSDIKLPSPSFDMNLDSPIPTSINNNNNNNIKNEIELDRIKQQQNGFLINYDDYKILSRNDKISIDHFPDLSSFPIHKDIHFTFEDCKKLISNSSKQDLNYSKSPEKYKWSPINILIPLMISIHMDKHIIKCISSICEEETLVYKNGNIKPLIEHIFSHSTSIDHIKSYIEEYIWSNFSLEIASRLLPKNIENKLKKKSDIDFKPLK